MAVITNPRNPIFRRETYMGVRATAAATELAPPKLFVGSAAFKMSGAAATSAPSATLHVENFGDRSDQGLLGLFCSSSSLGSSHDAPEYLAEETADTVIEVARERTLVSTKRFHPNSLVSTIQTQTASVEQRIAHASKAISTAADKSTVRRGVDKN